MWVNKWKPTFERRPLGRPKRRWECNIKTDLKNNTCRTRSVRLRIQKSGEILWTLNWTLRFCKMARNFLTSCGTVSFSRSAMLIHCDYIRSDQIRLDQVRSGQIRSDQIRSRLCITSRTWKSLFEVLRYQNVSGSKFWTKRIQPCAFWRTANSGRFVTDFVMNSILCRTR